MQPNWTPKHIISSPSSFDSESLISGKTRTAGGGRIQARRPNFRRRVIVDVSHDHEADRSTQIAAGSPPVARTATNSRSISAANSDVRVPEAVGTCLIR
jgi:hypothetical protein